MDEWLRWIGALALERMLDRVLENLENGFNTKRLEKLGHLNLKPHACRPLLHAS